MLETAKGMRDISGNEMRIRREIIDKMYKLFQTYGYEELETPIVEKYDVLTYKYSEDEEILKEIYKLEDQAGRSLCLRYDHTVPLCRFIGMNPTMKMPYKRFAIGKVYRDGPIKLGRTREFIQCDFDIIGANSINSEIELISMFARFFKSINLDIRIEINNIKFLKKIIEYLEIEHSLSEKVIAVIDKIKKQPRKVLEKELESLGIEKSKSNEIFENISLPKEQLLEFFENKFDDLEKDVEDLRLVLKEFDFLDFNLGLARGLSYYTGIVFEVFTKNSEFTSSLGSGGRYDKLIGDYLNGKKEFCAVGGSFGLEPIMTQIKELEEKSNTKLYIIPIRNFEQSRKIAEQFRDAGINTSIDLQNRNVGKNMDYANAKKIEYVIVIGDKEIESRTFQLKNMFNGRQEEVTLNQAIELLK